MLEIASKQDVITLSVAPCIRKGIGVEIGRGCNHGCIYCFSACSTSSTETTLAYFANAAEVLEQFLKRHEQEIENVHLGYITDFLQQAGPDVERVRLQILDTLQRYNVSVSCLTKGKPSTKVQQAIDKLGRRFMLMLDTGCGDLQWEPNILPLKERVQAIAPLTCFKAARIDPVIPGVNDDKHWFAPVCKLLQAAGVEHVDVSFLFLTDEVADAIEDRLGEKVVDKLYSYYSDNNTERLGGSVAWTGEHVNMDDIRYRIDTVQLPSPNAHYRLKVIERLRQVASNHNITVRLCNCKNKSLVGHTSVCSDTRTLRERSRIYS